MTQLASKLRTVRCPVSMLCSLVANLNAVTSVGVVVRDITIGAGGDGFDSRASQIRRSRKQLAAAAAFLRNCVAQAVSRGMGPATRYTLIPRV